GPATLGRVTFTYTMTDGGGEYTALVVVDIPPRPAPFSGAVLSANGFSFNISGPAGSYWDVYASSDLNSWSLIAGTTLNSSGVASFSDSGAVGLPRRFYRFCNDSGCLPIFGFLQLQIPAG